jgi:hypothetical protein
MSRSRIAIITLVAALVASNAWWFYQAIDVAVTGEHQAVAYREHREALTQTLAIIPVVARPDTTKQQVLDAALKAAQHKEPFEKDRFVWVGRLGLKFDDSGRLVEVVPSWSPD